MSIVLNNRGYWDPERFPLVAAYCNLTNDVARRRFITRLRCGTHEEEGHVTIQKMAQRKPAHGFQGAEHSPAKMSRPYFPVVTLAVAGVAIVAVIAAIVMFGNQF